MEEYECRTGDCTGEDFSKLAGISADIYSASMEEAYRLGELFFEHIPLCARCRGYYRSILISHKEMIESGLKTGSMESLVSDIIFLDSVKRIM